MASPLGQVSTLSVAALPQGATTVLNVTSATVIKASAGTLLAVNVIAAGSSNGTINDAASVATSGAANAVAVINSGTDVVPGALNAIPEGGWPVANGIVVNTGTGQIVSVLYK